MKSFIHAAPFQILSQYTPSHFPLLRISSGTKSAMNSPQVLPFTRGQRVDRLITGTLGYSTAG